VRLNWNRAIVLLRSSYHAGFAIFRAFGKAGKPRRNPGAAQPRADLWLPVRAMFWWRPVSQPTIARRLRQTIRGGLRAPDLNLRNA
jgi:hypothetical protein